MDAPESDTAQLMATVVAGRAYLAGGSHALKIKKRTPGGVLHLRRSQPISASPDIAAARFSAASNSHADWPAGRWGPPSAHLNSAPTATLLGDSGVPQGTTSIHGSAHATVPVSQPCILNSPAAANRVYRRSIAGICRGFAMNIAKCEFCTYDMNQRQRYSYPLPRPAVIVRSHITHAPSETEARLASQTQHLLSTA